MDYTKISVKVNNQTEANIAIATFQMLTENKVSKDYATFIPHLNNYVGIGRLSKSILISPTPFLNTEQISISEFLKNCILKTENKMDNLILGHHFSKYTHSSVVVIEIDGVLHKSCISVEDTETHKKIYLCTNSEKLDGIIAPEMFGYAYSILMAIVDRQTVDVTISGRIKPIDYLAFTGKTFKKKLWYFKADGLALTIHSSENDKMICNVTNSDGILANSVESLLKKQGYHTYNFSFNERGQMIFPFGD